MPRVHAPSDAIVIAIDSFCGSGPDGTSYVVRSGERYRGTDGVVRAFPDLFRDWATTTDAELKAARNERFAREEQ